MSLPGRTGGRRAVARRWATRLVLALLMGCPPVLNAQAQEKSTELEDLARGVTDWMRENLDDDLLMSLGEVDFARVQELFDALLRKFDANDIYDLASAKESALRLLPVLKQFEETRPYAAWLETRLDYLEAAETLRRAAEPTPPKSPAPRPLPPPSPDAQIKLWDGRLARRPIPSSGQALVPRLKPIFRTAGIPAELVWLAEVESSFDPTARSPKGAAGLFQLMPTTARSLGLSTWPIDERLAPDSNARAAAKYLRYLHGRFGDWRLALAAYNAGETRVSNLLSGAKARSFASIANRLPAETQMYVPRFEATLRKREGVAITSLGAPR